MSDQRNWGRELARGREPAEKFSRWHEHYKVLWAIGSAWSDEEFSRHEGGFEHAYRNFRRYAWTRKRWPGPAPPADARPDPAGVRIRHAVVMLCGAVKENPFFRDGQASPRVQEVKQRLLDLGKLCIYVDRECGQVEIIFPRDEGG
jgi:hypothetical protein